MLWRPLDSSNVRRVVSHLGRRERRLGWVRRLPPRDLDHLIHTIEHDLAGNPTRDSLLDHVARLHFDTRARARRRGAEALVGDTDSARCAIEAFIFEQRYGERMLDAIADGASLTDAWEEANLYVEGALRRLGIDYTRLDAGHWVHETRSAVIHLHHYPAPRILDLYAPLAPAAEAGEGMFAELLAENGGSVAGAFYGVCTFGGSGEHICACGRVATEHLAGPDLAYVINSIVALADRYAELA